MVLIYFLKSIFYIIFLKVLYIFILYFIVFPTIIIIIISIMQDKIQIV